MNDLLPNALMIGVDYELFWTLNPKSLSPFVKAFELRMKVEDRIAWQNGNYVRHAIASCFDKNAKYPTKPLMSTSVPSETPEERQQRIKEKMFQQMKLINPRFKKEE